VKPKARSPEIGRVIEDAMGLIEKENHHHQYRLRDESRALEAAIRANLIGLGYV